MLELSGEVQEDLRKVVSCISTRGLGDRLFTRPSTVLKKNIITLFKKKFYRENPKKTDITWNPRKY
jgi:hypothetical protein